MCVSGVTMPTCAALGKRGLVTAGWAAGAAGRVTAGAGAMWGIPGLGGMWGGTAVGWTGTRIRSVYMITFVKFSSLCNISSMVVFEMKAQLTRRYPWHHWGHHPSHWHHTAKSRDPQKIGHTDLTVNYSKTAFQLAPWLYYPYRKNTG